MMPLSSLLTLLHIASFLHPMSSFIDRACSLPQSLQLQSSRSIIFNHASLKVVSYLPTLQSFGHHFEIYCQNIDLKFNSKIPNLAVIFLVLCYIFRTFCIIPYNLIKQRRFKPVYLWVGRCFFNKILKLYICCYSSACIYTVFR